MEMPIEMMSMPDEKPRSADIREEADRVGTETVTTPAGTFACEHYRMKDKSADFWVAEKVSPYGLVKMTTQDGTVTLTRLISNAQTKIKGTPRKFDPREMMRQQPE